MVASEEELHISIANDLGATGEQFGDVALQLGLLLLQVVLVKRPYQPACGRQGGQLERRVSLAQLGERRANRVF